MQFSRNPSTFFFMSLDQPVPHAGKSVLRQLPLGNVYARSYVAGKRTVRIQSGHAYIEEPAVLPVVPLKAILHLERVPEVESFLVGIHAMPEVFRVHLLCPAVAQFCLKRSACELQPRLVEVVAQFV